jgi:hypothetical protein
MLHTTSILNTFFGTSSEMGSGHETYLQEIWSEDVDLILSEYRPRSKKTVMIVWVK